MQEKKVFIVTEGSKKIGFGHITRCWGLYEAFCKMGVKPTFILNSDDSVKSLLNHRDYYIFDWLKEESKLLDTIKNADVVIIDSYLANFKIYKKISELSKLSVYIDDNKRMDYPAGTVLNGNIHSKNLNYPKISNVNYLLGTQYLPLRKDFWRVPDNEINKKIETIMLTFGGDDLRNMTPKVLGMLEKEFPAVLKKVIVGKGFKNIKEIEKIKSDKIELVYFPEAKGMIDTMLKSDLTISAGGQTLYELARLGVPTIAIVVAHNQINHVNYWQKTKFIDYAGFWDDANCLKNILGYLNTLKNGDLRKEKSRIGRSCVDGLGSMRIAEYCLQNIG